MLFRRPQSQPWVKGDFTGDPAVPTEIEITYEVEIEGDAPVSRLRALIDHVDAIAEIPNSPRKGTAVRLNLGNAGTTGEADEPD